MSNRSDAGYLAKVEGHKMEHALAHSLGRDFKASEGVQKTDVIGDQGKTKISLKNSAGASTQIALVAQSTFKNFINANKEESEFIRLFFGFADGSKLNKEKLLGFDIDFDKLSDEDEIDRNRVLYNNIPEKYSTQFLNKLNQQSKSGDFFKKIIVGDSTILAWVKEKNKIEGIKYALMSDVVELLSAGQWEIAPSNSVIQLIVDGKKIMHIQMKGSSERFSSGYHSCMVHMYKLIMYGVKTKTNLNELSN